MRLWSIHPRYLDRRGLVALWREALLARHVLAGQTRGYRHHPQLARFKATADPLGAIDRYLAGVLAEADRRGYRFDAGKIGPTSSTGRLPVTEGQLAYETAHLLAKLKIRDPGRWSELTDAGTLAPHPLFAPVSGPVEAWEIISESRG